MPGFDAHNAIHNHIMQTLKRDTIVSAVLPICDRQKLRRFRVLDIKKIAHTINKDIKPH